MRLFRWMLLALALPVAIGGCTASAPTRKQHRRGPKVNLVHFIDHTNSYKGRTLQLILKPAEPIDRTRGESLRNYLGRDVKFTTPVPGRAPLTVVVAIPKGLSVPEVGSADDVCVTFVCERGALTEGNKAKEIETP